ncbi:expressed unknown protein [Ectocarpus siliculosus]|uniref:Uncharacterized protein n=1 Tax=Ectocarpus siliculosus TaxID=2880 RepID=D7G3X2_ECTSI|nr:expressed unknown protein [Ectocarpus siliculosus]|eukprot:CBJ33649.1 expressed unknown protein [Ectocarpus siliculosus]
MASEDRGMPELGVEDVLPPVSIESGQVTHVPVANIDLLIGPSVSVVAGGMFGGGGGSVNPGLVMIICISIQYEVLIIVSRV